MELSITEKLQVKISNREIEFLPYPSELSADILQKFNIDFTNIKCCGNLMLGLADVFQCFDDVVSHTIIQLKINRSDRVEVMDWTAQNTALVCLFFRMVNSDCSVFSKFKDYLNLFSVSPTPHFFIKSNMMEVFLEKLARNEPINLNEVKKIALERNREATEILLKIKDLVEGKFKKESILNSVVMGINIATINYEFFDEFFEELKGKYRLQ